MYCAECGKTLHPNAKFCDNCGWAIPKKPPVEEQEQPPVMDYPPAVEQWPLEKPPAPKKKKKILLWILIICALIATILWVFRDDIFGGKGSSGETGGQRKTSDITFKDDGSMTVMIYMVGSDLETDAAAASLDIMEMLDSGVDTDKHNILLYTGGAEEWHHQDVSSNKNQIHRIDDGELERLESLDADNMADADTLQQFLSYSVENYPAEHYALVLWDHGGGPMGGFGYDQRHEEMMSVEGIMKALSNTGFGPDGKLEFLGFDACLMSSAEIAWCAKDYAHYMIASQENEPGFGWNYLWLEALNDTIEGDELGQVIVDAYFTGYPDEVENWDMTLSCLDLSKMEDLETDLNALFSEVDEDVLEGAFKKLSRLRKKTKTFGYTVKSEDNCDLVDMYHLASLLKSSHKEEAEALMDTLEQVVCYNKSNVDNACGLSIYHPYENRDYAQIFVSMFEDFDFAEDYSSYIENFGSHLTENTNKNHDGLKDSDGESQQFGSEEQISVQLGDSLAEDYADSLQYIVQHIGGNEYILVYMGTNAELGEDNVLTATYDRKALYVVDDRTGQKTELPVMILNLPSEDDEQQFVVPAVFYRVNEDGEEELDSVYWKIAIKDGKPRFRGAYLMVEDENLDSYGQRYSVDYRDYDTVYFFAWVLTPDGDIESTTVSVLDWEQPDPILLPMEVSNGMHLEYLPMEDPGSCYAQFEVFDIYNNSYCNEPFPLD